MGVGTVLFALLIGLPAHLFAGIVRRLVGPDRPEDAPRRRPPADGGELATLLVALGWEPVERVDDWAEYRAPSCGVSIAWHPHNAARVILRGGDRSPHPMTPEQAARAACLLTSIATT